MSDIYTGTEPRRRRSALEIAADIDREDEQEEIRRRARFNLSGPARQITPDDAAAAQSMGSFRGDMGYGGAVDPTGARRAREARRADLMLNLSPRLERWLAEPQNAAVARDDLPTLSFMERLSDISNTIFHGSRMQTRTEQDIADLSELDDAWRQGQRQIEMSRLGNRLNNQALRVPGESPPLSGVELERLRRLESIPRERYEGLDAVAEVLLPQIFGTFEAGGRRAVRDARASWQRQTNEIEDMSPIGGAYARLWMPLKAGAAGAAGYLRGTVGYTYEQEAGGAYLEFRQLVDENGNQMSPEIAGEHAARVGEINAFIEFLGLGVLTRASGVGELASQMSRQGVREAIRRIGYREVAQRFAMATAGGAVAEGLTEMTQEGVIIAMGELARQQQGGEWADLQPDEVGQRLWDAFRIGATVGGTFASVPAGIRAGYDLRDVRTARDQQELFDALASGSEASALRRRAPARYAEAVDALTAGGPLEQVSVDAERFVELFQEQNRDPFEVADTLRGVGADQLREALERGGEITMPMGTYAAQIAGSDVDAGLRPHIRMGPDQMTPAEVAARIELGVDLERAADQAQRLLREADAIMQESEGVRERIEALFTRADGYVESANAAYSKWFGAAITTMAERAGMRGTDLLDEIGLSIEGPFDAMRAEGALEQARGVSSERRSESWTPPEDVRLSDRVRSYVEMARNNYTNEEIAEEWDTDPRTVAVALSIAKRKLGGAVWEELPANAGRRGAGVSTEQIVRVVEQLRKAGSPRVITTAAERLGISPNAVSTRLSVYRRNMQEGLQQFAGEGAETAPVDTLEIAKELHADGVSADTIWEMTGWALGDDGRWRFEIDTNGARITVQLRQPRETDIRALSEVLDFPTLYAAYPQLADVPVDMALGKKSGKWDRAHDTYEGRPVPLLTVRARSLVAAREVLLHEIQHAIQDIEGFATGSEGKSGWDEYWNSAGEVEARNVERRTSLTSAEKRRKAPNRTADVAAPDRIVVMARPDAAFSLPEARWRAALRDPETGEVYLGVNHADALEQVPEERWDTVLADEGASGFVAPDGRFLSREAAMAEMGRRAGADDVFNLQERWYHGTSAQIDGDLRPGDPSSSQRYGPAIYLTNDPMVADMFAGVDEGIDGAQVLPVFVRGKYATPEQYQAALEKAGDPDGAQDALIAQGYSGIRDDANGELAVFSHRDVRSVLAQRARRRGPSGSIVMSHLMEGGDLRDATIKLFEGRDLSTPLHEGGHLFLEVLQLLASRVQQNDEMTATQEQLLRDWQAVLDWFGVSEAQWSSFNLEQKRQYHERWARGMEAYLLEGKAPSAQMRDVFAMFKRWLTWIYKSVLALDVQLTPEIRQVMDRMVATDEAIDAARRDQGASAVIPREQFGGTDKQYARYLANIERAREDALADVQKEALGALMADRTRWWRSEEAKTRRAVEIDVDADPARRAYEWLAYQRWRNDGVPEGLEPIRLSPAAIVENYGQDALDALPPELVRVDSETLVVEAKAVRRMLRQKGPLRFTAWIQQQGGVRDPNGDVKVILGSASARPGVINNATGMHMDDLILRAWEDGWFGTPPGRLFQTRPDAGGVQAGRLASDGGGAQGSGELFQGERPTIREFLDKLDGDMKDQPAYRMQDEELVEARRQAEQMRDWFAERGVDINATEKELREQIGKMAAREDAAGVDPDFAASLFGFPSGEDLLKALSSLTPRREAIEAETRRRMLLAYGDPMADGSLMEGAQFAVHREAQARQIEIELEAIDRATGGAVRPVSRAAKDIAAKQIERMTVRQIRRFDWFLGNERRHAREALEKLERGDVSGARSAKHRQLVNFHLYALAKRAAKELDAAQRYFRKFDRPGVRANIDADYLAQIDALLEQYEFKKISQREEQRRISLNEWVRRMEAAGLGHMVAIDPRLLEDAGKRPFSQLDMSEVRAVIDAVKNIEHLGRLKDKLLTAAEDRSFRETVGELAERLNRTGPISEAQRKNYSPTAFERVQDRMREAHAEMTRMEFLFRYLDGGEANGPMWRALWLPFTEAANKESAMMRVASQAMEATWARYTDRERTHMFKRRIAMPDLPVGAATHYTKAELIAIALNLGNDGNVRALVDGFGWGAGRRGVNKLTDEQYAAAREQIVLALSRVLDARDWQTVQMIWDQVGSFRDEAFALQRDLTGLEAQAVEAQSLTLPDGTVLAGGYYPLKFDRTRDVRQDRAESKQEVQEAFGSNWSRPMTRKGHLIERVGSGGRPVKLSLTVFSEHVQNVVHDIAYRRAVIDADKIVTDDQFAETFISVAGKPMYDQLRPWLQAIAADRVDPSAFMWKFLQKLRGNVAIAAMGYRVSTGLQQLVGVLQAVPMLGSGEMASALTQLVRNPATIAQKARVIANKSEFMRTRMQTMDRDIRETIDRMERSDKLYPIRHNAFALVGIFDWAVSSVVWTAGYNKAMRGEVAGIEAGDEAAAVLYGDQAVRTTQSAGLPQDLPAIMRGNQVNKLLTMFFSYFSVLYNWTAFDQVMATRKGRVPLHVFVANMALIYIVSPLIAEALAGRWEPRDDEDDEARNARLASVVLRMPFQTVPVLRDFANAVGTGFEYQLSPAQSGPAQIAKAISDAAEGRTFESEATTKRAVVAAGYAFGLPTPQAWTMIDYLADKLEGEEEGFDPVEAFVADRR